MKLNGENRPIGLLRFTTAGSVDDGKSTLIGRLLYDSKSIFEDQMEHIVQSSKRLGKEETDLSLLTDGLRAEREQGITIDVAYRYFATPARKFIIADTPGHIQYTRNMVTGASTADLAVILIDSRKGVVEQTMRHTYIASLLDIRHIVFCINKMDLVGYSEDVYLRLCDDLKKLGSRLGTGDLHFIPISAKYGDNVVSPSENMKWYGGKTFLNLIETIEIGKKRNSGPARFPVQTVIRPLSSEYHDYRGYAGRVASGTFSAGDRITVLPSGMESEISSITVMGKTISKAEAGDSVTLNLTDQIDISRGDMIVKKGEMPESGVDINLMVCWFNEKPLQQGRKYLIRNNTNETTCVVSSINYRMNISNLERETAGNDVNMNDIANISIRTPRPLYYDCYKNNNITGSMIFIEEGTNETVGAGMICGEYD
ncbi:MAG TPA: GTP-binding protein [Bacteroidales bacterium]|jgi:sulfate adenylyltransferase subunit 1|nr:GTP-binding protein [Bacteroidales bacterium]HNR42374.1 GTP-binding protein [Bacteroidales bacterium]HPM18802.1 GTP-binding protein [Bacteroidales bacterium]HPV15885.1 GTP-binding protein [Bacteroidales bacterium]